MSVQNFVVSHAELLQFLESYRDQLFYIAIDVEPPPEGARAFNMTTFPDEIAADVIRIIHRDIDPPRMSPEVRQRIEDATLGQARVTGGVNIDPVNPHGTPPSPETLRDCQWVRLVFVGQLYQRPLEQAFAYYDPIINAYNDLGVNVLLVLNQQTYGDGTGYDLRNMDAGRWASYTNEFVAVVEQITHHYGNRVAAYEIWNEGDVPHNPASIYIPPAHYAPLLDRSASSVRRNAPRSKVIVGGLVGGSGISARYVRDTRTALGGALPVDGIGVHPYGMGAPGVDNPYAPFGSVQWVFDALHAVAPNVPLWLTEFGALGSRDQQFWHDAAAYMHAMFDYLRTMPHKVPVAIWWAWSDAMHFEGGTNGLVGMDGQPKQPIYDTFFAEMRD